MDLIEGRDEDALLRYLPDDITGFEMTMEGGRYQVSPQCLDDVEAAFEDFSRELRGDSIEVLQSNETVNLGTATLTWTVKVVDGSMERIMPLKVVLSRSGSDDRWVVTRIELFN
ncbi:MAG: hypothetical protein V1918_07710 [Planctomycetota bacterium]